MEKISRIFYSINIQKQAVLLKLDELFTFSVTYPR